MADGKHSALPRRHEVATLEELRPLVSKAKTIAVLSPTPSATKPSIDDMLTLPKSHINEENRSNPEEDMESATQDYRPMGHAAFYKMYDQQIICSIAKAVPLTFILQDWSAGAYGERLYRSPGRPRGGQRPVP